MVKSKTTKEIRAIDSWVKFQIDDGLESVTISGKDTLADLEMDEKGNLTLYLNADKDKINEIKSLIPFVNIKTLLGGTETNKEKTIELSQDLTQFALEISDNSKELASFIKSKSSILLDLDGLVQQLIEISGKISELEQKDQEQDNRLTSIETKQTEINQQINSLKLKPIILLNSELKVVLFDIGENYIIKFIQQGTGYGGFAVISGDTYNGGGMNVLSKLNLTLPAPVEYSTVTIPLINNSGYPCLILIIDGTTVTISPNSKHSAGGIVSNTEFILKKKMN